MPSHAHSKGRRRLSTPRADGYARLSVISDRDDPPLSLAPEPVRRRWMQQYALMMVVLGAAFEIWALFRGATFGFGVTDFAVAILYGGFATLFIVRTSPEVLLVYAATGLFLAQIPAFVELGFGAGAALLPCAIPVLVALFVGGRAAYLASAAGLACFGAVALLRLGSHVLPDADPRLVDPQRYINWVGLAIALVAVVGPLSWLVAQLIVTLDESLVALAHARSEHDAQVRLRMAADAALVQAVEHRQHARQSEAAGLVVAGVVHDFRNSLTVLHLWSESLQSDASADRTVHAAIGRIGALSFEAARVTRDLLAAARPSPVDDGLSCRAAEQTAAIARILRASLPADFQVSVASRLTNDPSVALDRFALTSTLLQITAAADVTRSIERRVELIVRGPDVEESAIMPSCVAVVEISLGPAKGELVDGIADLAVQRGGQLLVTQGPDGGRRARLLLSASAKSDPLASEAVEYADA